MHSGSVSFPHKRGFFDPKLTSVSLWSNHDSLPGMDVLKVGIFGTIVAAICCFTPALVILLSAIGLSWLIGALDIILIPAFVFFLAMTVYALWKRSRQQSN